MTRNSYAIWNRYGNRALGAQELHVFPNRAERDAWVDAGGWNERVEDFDREAVTASEARRWSKYITGVYQHGEVTVPAWVADLCKKICPYLPYPDIY